MFSNFKSKHLATLSSVELNLNFKWTINTFKDDIQIPIEVVFPILILRSDQLVGSPQRIIFWWLRSWPIIRFWTIDRYPIQDYLKLTQRSLLINTEGSIRLLDTREDIYSLKNEVFLLLIWVRSLIWTSRQTTIFLHPVHQWLIISS